MPANAAAISVPNVIEMAGLADDFFNYVPSVALQGIKIWTISTLSESQFWLWAGTSSCWKTYELPDTSYTGHGICSGKYLVAITPSTETLATNSF